LHFAKWILRPGGVGLFDLRKPVPSWARQKTSVKIEVLIKINAGQLDAHADRSTGA
jgi:hypothetical protein